MPHGKDPITHSPLLTGRVTKLHTPVHQLKAPNTKAARSRCPHPDFIRRLCGFAKAAASAAGQKCLCRVMIIHSAFETTWGTNPDLENDKNYFGLHGEGDAGSRQARKATKKTPMALYKTPEASFSAYWPWAQKHGVSYINEAQFVHDMTIKGAFSVGSQPQYIRQILNALSECDQELNACCGCKCK